MIKKVISAFGFTEAERNQSPFLRTMVTLSVLNTDMGIIVLRVEREWATPPGLEVRRDDSFGYCFQGDVDYKYSRESRTGNSFSELREKVINRSRPAALGALPTVSGEDSYEVFEHDAK